MIFMSLSVNFGAVLARRLEIGVIISALEHGAQEVDVQRASRGDGGLHNFRRVGNRDGMAEVFR
jgi:hypothetical protein